MRVNSYEDIHDNTKKNFWFTLVWNRNVLHKRVSCVSNRKAVAECSNRILTSMVTTALRHWPYFLLGCSMILYKIPEHFLWVNAREAHSLYPGQLTPPPKALHENISTSHMHIYPVELPLALFTKLTTLDYSYILYYSMVRIWMKESSTYNHKLTNSDDNLKAASAHTKPIQAPLFLLFVPSLLGVSVSTQRPGLLPQVWENFVSPTRKKR